MRRQTLLSSMTIPLLSLSMAAAAAPTKSGTDTDARFLVQAATVAIARQDVAHVGANVEHDLGIINAVAAHLNSRQAARLRAMQNVRLFPDRSLAARSLT